MAVENAASQHRVQAITEHPKRLAALSYGPPRGVCQHLGAPRAGAGNTQWSGDYPIWPWRVSLMLLHYDSVPSLDVLAGAADFHFSVECLVIGTPGSPVLVELRR